MKDDMAIMQAKIAELEADLQRHKSAGKEWLDKTEWVQKTVKAGELGYHRADIINRRFTAQAARLTEAFSMIERLADAIQTRLSSAENPLLAEARAMANQKEG